jgi:hypothetical protein
MSLRWMASRKHCVAPLAEDVEAALFDGEHAENVPKCEDVDELGRMTKVEPCYGHGHARFSSQ